MKLIRKTVKKVSSNKGKWKLYKRTKLVAIHSADISNWADGPFPTLAYLKLRLQLSLLVIVWFVCFVLLLFHYIVILLSFVCQR